MYERMNIEDWKAKKKNDRDAVLADQKQALQEVLQDGAHLTAYLLGRGRLGSGITSGNAALVLKACPQATAVMSFDGWNQFGRRVSKGAVGISQLVRSGGYFTVGKVYDRSATYGNKPCPTVELQGEQLGKAVAVLTALSTVEVQFDDKQPTGFLADENLILYPSGASNEEVLARLPADTTKTVWIFCSVNWSSATRITQLYCNTVRSSSAARKPCPALWSRRYPICICCNRRRLPR